MTRAILAVCVVYILTCLGGCGGSSTNGSGGLETDVHIQNNGVFALFVTTAVGNRVTWINNTSNIQTVTSGVLNKVSNPKVATPRILIQQNNTFVPSFLEANFGDTIEWQNNRTGAFQLQIVDQANNVVATLDFQVGQVVQYSGFPRAGTYRFQQSGVSAVSGELRLYGVPSPDNQFVSTLAPNGGSFTRPFPTAGVYDYYVVTASSPGLVFLNGRITIQ